MLKLKELFLRGKELYDNHAFIMKPDNSAYSPSRAASVNLKISNLKRKLATIGKGDPITKVDILVNHKKTFTLYYLTHDEEELDWLIKRDYGTMGRIKSGMVSYYTTKYFTGQVF